MRLYRRMCLFCVIIVVYLGHGTFHPGLSTFFPQNKFLGEFFNAFTTGNPFFGTELLAFSTGRGSGALIKGLSSQIEEPPEKKWCARLYRRNRVFSVTKSKKCNPIKKKSMA